MSVPYGLLIRHSDGKCRAVYQGKNLTGWCADGMAVVDAMRRREKSAHSIQSGGEGGEG